MRALIDRRLLLRFAAVVWLCAVMVGLAALWMYSSSAGAAARPPERWPSESGVARQAGTSTLLMVVHPRCPCSRASVEELGRLMASAGNRLAATVLFVRPDGVDDAWVETDLWRSAAAIPGVRVVRDDGGVEAQRFGSATSGQTMLYDDTGRLRFSGGITAARGHAGDNEGRSAVLALVRHQAETSAGTPVFGCALFSAEPCDP